MKPQLKPYRVRFEKLNKRTQQYETAERIIEATGPGGAFYKVHKRYPSAKLLGCHIKDKMFGNEIWIDYEVPSLAKVEPLPSTRFTQTEMNL